MIDEGAATARNLETPVRYRIKTIPRSVASLARTTMKAPGYGHPVHRDVALGYGPCRSCLRPFEEGTDRRLLFTYDPFHDLEPFPLPGPVYVHEAPCEPYHDVHRFPDALRFIPMTLDAYGRDRTLREARRVEAHGPVEEEIADLVGRHDVDYIHVRNTEAGCFLFQIQREYT
jgi:hypothetical protein